MKGPGISFVLPMYNEAPIARATIETFMPVARSVSDDFEVIIVDDGSTDGSADEVGHLIRGDRRVRLIRLPQNSLFAGALLEGLAHATKDIVTYIDFDIPIRGGDVARALSLIGEYDIVSAVCLSRKHASAAREAMSLTYNAVIRALFGVQLRDLNSGFKMFKRDVLSGLTVESRSPFVDAEIIIKALRAGKRVKQIPLAYVPRKGGCSKMMRPALIIRTVLDIIAFALRGRA